MDDDLGPRWARLASLPIALLALGVSVYLTYVHYTEPTSLSCPATGAINCTKVTTSPESMLFGVIPVAVTGIPYFALMAALVSPWGWRLRTRWADVARVAGVVGGVGMVIYLVYVEVLVVEAICLWCTVVHVLTFALFVTVLVATLLRPEPTA